MELQEVYSLMDRFAASGLTALEWEHGGERIALRRVRRSLSPPPRRRNRARW